MSLLLFSTPINDPRQHRNFPGLVGLFAGNTTVAARHHALRLLFRGALAPLPTPQLSQLGQALRNTGRPSTRDQPASIASAVAADALWIAGLAPHWVADAISHDGNGHALTFVSDQSHWMAGDQTFVALNSTLFNLIDLEATNMGITEIINTFDHILLTTNNPQITESFLLDRFKEVLSADSHKVLTTAITLRVTKPTAAPDATSCNATILNEVTAAIGRAVGTPVSSPAPAQQPTHNAVLASIVDPALAQMGLPSSATIANAVSALSAMKGTTLDQVPSLLGAASQVAVRVKELEAKLAMAPAVQAAVVQASGALPAGKVTLVNAKTLWPNMKTLDFDVPVWAWDAPHPWVPQVSPAYQFREEYLRTILYAIAHDKRLWLHGHTGTGKTTLVEQVAARLGYPVRRVNFTGDTEAYSLIGQKVLTTDPATNQTVTTWQDGALPQAMQSPCILLLDEISFAKPGTIGALQAVTEPRGVLFLQEDGNRAVHPDPMLRIFATDNTAGQGDETGLYAGTRPANAAAFSRFALRLKVGYLDRQDEAKLLCDLVPALNKQDADRIANFAHEARLSLDKGEIYLPVSPRCTIEMAEMYAFLVASGTKPRVAMAECLNRTVLDDVATASDAAVLRGLAQRTNCL